MNIRRSLAVVGASATLALGFGGVMAPSAQADSLPWQGDARYTQTDLDTGSARTGTAVESPGGTEVAPPLQAASLRCWNASVSGRAFSVSCSGVRYYVYGDCTNSRRYVAGPFAGAKRVTIVCPAGTRSVGGGAYGS